jgi:hypothetical protein
MADLTKEAALLDELDVLEARAARIVRSITRRGDAVRAEGRGRKLTVVIYLNR